MTSHILTGAHDISVGRVTNVQGDYNHYVNVREGNQWDNPLGALLDASALNAMHDAPWQDDTGMLTTNPPSPRHAITEELNSWADRDNQCNGPLCLWLTGPPGSGTTIARILAKYFQRKSVRRKCQLAAAFFFHRDDKTRNSIARFVPTIAYQLTIWNEEVKERILDVVKSYPTILRAGLDLQWQRLILEPLKGIDAGKLLPAVIIIDALCQCGALQDQTQLLRLMGSCGPNSPLAFLVTSSFEPHAAHGLHRLDIDFKQIALEELDAVRQELSDLFDRVLGAASNPSRRERGALASGNVIKDAVNEVSWNYICAVETVSDAMLGDNERLRLDNQQLGQKVKQLELESKQLREKVGQVGLENQGLRERNMQLEHVAIGTRKRDRIKQKFNEKTELARELLCSGRHEWKTMTMKNFEHASRGRLSQAGHSAKNRGKGKYHFLEL
ncbi:hypothetical protein AX16_006920 [Volvariella volvacea WC 439]|nr:hypothetical protein AX16_006920 [Volvariella volvacea WC 439]